MSGTRRVRSTDSRLCPQPVRLKIVRSEEASQELQGLRAKGRSAFSSTERADGSFFARRIWALCRVDSTCVWGSFPPDSFSAAFVSQTSPTVAATRLTRGVYSTGVETTFGTLGMAFCKATPGNTYASQQLGTLFRVRHVCRLDHHTVSPSGWQAFRLPPSTRLRRSERVDPPQGNALSLR